MVTPAETLIALSRQLSAAVDTLKFSAGPPGNVTHVYNPLTYARQSWEAYLQLAAAAPRAVVFLGMNPGPWGMAQTGVPFGEVAAVRDWMGIRAKSGAENGVEIGTPDHPHPKRPIQGFDCPRSEVSGRRLWGLMQDRFGSAERFFESHFVANYCPLVFMSETGRNVTPDKLTASEREPLFKLCDEFLIRTIDALDPRYVIGVGKFAEKRIRMVLKQLGQLTPDVARLPRAAASRGGVDASDRAEAGAGEPAITVGTILHPSPA
ncbi:MAG: hypothetical protein KAU31_05545, partial [Spirochaetaceae bacterium]|nr:hypothetical protein [Spirochaetaceae bacterium]